MQHHSRWIILVLIIGLMLSGCTKVVESAMAENPARIEPIDGTELSRVILTESAAARLDVQTVPVREESVDGTQRLVVPYSAVIYDLRGGTWVYASPENLTFVRTPITVDYIAEDKAILTEGPPIGMAVATVGVAELYGAETGIGK